MSPALQPTRMTPTSLAGLEDSSREMNACVNCVFAVDDYECPIGDRVEPITHEHWVAVNAYQSDRVLNLLD